MKLTIFAICVALFVSINVSFADETSHKKAVERLLTITKVDKQIEPMFHQMKNMVFNQYKNIDLTPDKKSILEKHTNRMFDLFSEEMSWDKMKNDYINLYVSAYTEQEINGLIQFYETPLGQKFIEKMPQLMQSSVQLSQQYAARLMPAIQKITQEMTDELK